MNTPTLSRRKVLRGLGTAMALPFLESLLPCRSFAALSTDTVAKAAAGPRRVAWVYVPNGIDMQNWTPATFGADYELTPTLNVLADYRSKMMVISGLVCDKANPNGDTPGDHARANSAYLTGTQPRKAGGIHLGVSADQVAAAKIGQSTKFPSLEIGMEDGKKASTDSGYPLAYSHNLSWRNATTPVTKDVDPQSVFDRMFTNGIPGETEEARAIREHDQSSILDFVLNDANSVQKRLAANDRQKLDEYLTSVREIEIRLQRAKNEPPPPLPAGAVRPEMAYDSSTEKKVGISTSSDAYPTHIQLMIDMMVLAFQADLTRVITFPFADEGSNQQYPWGDANVPHHGTSHHMGDEAKMALLAKINQYHLTQFKYMLGKLDSIQEGNGSILDNCLIGYGSGNSDGNRHNHDNLPFVLLGKGGNSIKTGRHLDATGVPINNLWLSMLEHTGASVDKLGDSTGKLSLT
ncbi:MAG TPA: DUF1552 domain-containing protein [Opitutales bacterium]|jgi:hypothetical protein|nr:DUF1552 domain-containing protein [Opitutales bacterium]